MLPPVMAGSTQGELNHAQAGKDSPASRNETSVATTTNPPPALSPAMAMFSGANPWASTKRGNQRWHRRPTLFER